MTRTPLTAAALAAALIAVASCGGGGGGNPVTSTDQPTQDELDAAEQERLEREEAERLAQEEAERLERERLAREEAERQAAEQERREREAREQAEREEAARREREEQERLERERREREARERAEREAAERAAARLPFPLEAWNGTWYDPATNITWYPAAFGTQHYGISRTPRLTAADAQHMPIYHDTGYGGGLGLEAPERRIFVGVDQGSTHIADLTAAGERGDIDVRHGRLNDGVGLATLESYLSHAGASARYSSGSASSHHPRNPPKIRVVGGASAHDIDSVIRAVQLVNASLPKDAKVAVAPELPGLSLIGRDESYDANSVANALFNTVHIEFVPASEYRRPGNSAAVTFHFGSGRTYIQFNMGAVSYGRPREKVILLAHELMHGLADIGHLPANFPTIMEATGVIHHFQQNGQKQPLSLLYSVDREALQALHSRIDYGRIWVDDSSILEQLGPWASTSTHIAGNGPHANFGVALRNGYAEPWAHGYMPSQDLAENVDLYDLSRFDGTDQYNVELTGSATWTGTLLGLTPDAEAVAGDAEIGVQLATLTGRADFTALESWDVGVAPGAAGTGTTWGDGDLGYTIAVTGNTFRETGGDDGTLTGIFTGAAHEGAAGTLERSDLTGAFGASR